MIDNTETNNTDTLGKRIMALRKAAGMTQEQVAERLGVSPQAVSQWENDVSCPDVTMIPRIAQLFNVSTDELLGLKASTVRPADTSSYSHGNGSCCKSSSATQGIGFGLLLILKPDAGMATAMVLLGVALVLDALLTFAAMLLLVKIIRHQRPDIIDVEGEEVA